MKRRDDQVVDALRDSMLQAARRALTSAGTLQNTYLATLQSGELTLEAFRSSQEQFFFAVHHFARPMATLLARFEEPVQRVEILRNVVEEHGDLDPRRFHSRTFREFLESIGASADPRKDVTQGPEVEAFNRALDGVCAQGPTAEALATMGNIELAFADISASIGRAVVERGWLDEDQLAHYSLHAELDHRHASDFFDAMIADWTRSTGRRDAERGLELGAYLFERLYRDLAARAFVRSED